MPSRPLNSKSLRRSTYSAGLMAEMWCRLLLRLKGYGIVASRYRSPRGEIDILAVRGTILAVIEVKARPSYAAALEAILPRQRLRLEHAAHDFLARHPAYQRHDVRFDVMLVTFGHLPRHLKDAWRPGL